MMKLFQDHEVISLEPYDIYIYIILNMYKPYIYIYGYAIKICGGRPRADLRIFKCAVLSSFTTIDT